MWNQRLPPYQGFENVSSGSSRYALALRNISRAAKDIHHPCRYHGPRTSYWWLGDLYRFYPRRQKRKPGRLALLIYAPFFSWP
jgi:hypothetical protein